MRFWAKICCVFLAIGWMLPGILPGVAHAAGPPLFSDDFDASAVTCSTLSPNWTTSSATLAGISTHTSASNSCSLYTHGGAVSVTSIAVDLSSESAAYVTAWVRKGADSFSEDPDGTTEDLNLEYKTSAGAWVLLEAYSSNSLLDGEIVAVSVNVPTSGLHSTFQMRWRQSGGSGASWDYWHVDDVELFSGSLPPPPPLPSATLTANSCDDFESGLVNFTGSSATTVGTGSHTYASSSNSLYLRHSTASATSTTLNSAGLTTISMWIRRGSDTFSENPESGENLVVEYKNTSGTWVVLETFTGAGTQGQIFTRTYTVGASAQHGAFQIRYRLLSGSGSDFDYWHIDDLCLVGGSPSISVVKNSNVESDPINGTTNPILIPGAIVRYTIHVTNSGTGATDSNTVKISDTLDGNVVLFSGNVDGSGAPFSFVDVNPSLLSGLGLTYTGLGSGTDGVIFGNASGVSITPSSDYDGAVREFTLNLDGAMVGASGALDSEFTIEYLARVE